MGDENQHVRAALVTTFRDTDAGMVALAVLDAHWRVRAAVAPSALLSADQLALLGNDAHWRVVLTAKGNPLHPQHETFMASLKDDEDDEEWEEGEEEGDD
jgi:hypothetical protein